MRAPKTDVKMVLELAKTQRSVNRLHRNGFTNDRARTMRQIAFIPLHFRLTHPEYKKYFDPEMDKYEAKKNQMIFLRKMRDRGMDFSVVDKL